MTEQENNQQQNDDLFQYQDKNTPENTGADTEIPSAENDTETVQMTDTAAVPPVMAAPAEIRTPLLFSDRAPIPTRDGEVEQEVGYNRKHVITEKEKTFMPLSEDEIPQGSSLGQILSLARQKSGYSLERVCEITRISSNYITALEADELTVLPPGIYGPAYIRTISKCYRLSDSITQNILDYYKQHRAKKEELSPDFLKKLNDTAAVNPATEAEERRLTYIFYGVTIAVAAVIIIGLWALTSLLINVFSTPETAPDQKQDTVIAQTEQETIEFDQEQFRKLTPDPIEGKRVLQPGSKPQIRNR